MTPHLKSLNKPTTASRFSVCLPYVLKEEMASPYWSSESNLSHDPVPTFCGIEETEFWDWLAKHGLPKVPVQQMTEPEGRAIYYTNYWMPFCPQLPTGLDLQFLDSAVNEAPSEATRILQVALGITNDGIFGPQTEASVKEAVSSNTVPAVIKAFTARRLAVYKEIVKAHPEDAEYLAGWTTRAKTIGAAALAMVNAGTSAEVPTS